MRVRFRHPVSGVYAGIKLSQYSPGVVYEVPDNVGDRLRMMGAELAGPGASDGEPLLTDEQLTGGVTVFQSEAADRRPRKRMRARPKHR